MLKKWSNWKTRNQNFYSFNIFRIFKKILHIFKLTNNKNSSKLTLPASDRYSNLAEEHFFVSHWFLSGK